jgi:uncharacterized protein YndB with AHSA1/START domain
VFAAWADDQRLQQWYPERAHGPLLPGRRVELAWTSLGISIAMEVCERVEERRLVLRGDPGTGAQTQTITIAPAPGGSELVLEHDGLPSLDDREGCESGWRIALAVLREYVENQFGRSRQSFAVMASVGARREEIYARFARPSWLAEPAPSLSPVGSRRTLRLRGGPALRVDTIADTPGRELAIRCEDLATVIAFRALPAAGTWLAVVHVSSWSDDADAVAELRTALTSGVERLAGGERGDPARA